MTIPSEAYGYDNWIHEQLEPTDVHHGNAKRWPMDSNTTIFQKWAEWDKHKQEYIIMYGMEKWEQQEKEYKEWERRKWDNND